MWVGEWLGGSLVLQNPFFPRCLIDSDELSDLFIFFEIILLKRLTIRNHPFKMGLTVLCRRPDPTIPLLMTSYAVISIFSRY